MVPGKIAILVPAFNEAGNIAALLRELDATLAGLPSYDFLILFVDDGSSDDTAALLERAAAADPRIGVIELSRNFGKEMALTAGLQALDCDAAIIMDADLQHPPRYIPELIAQWRERYEIVSTRRVKIDEQPFARRFGSRLFYTLLNSISEFKMEPGTTDFRLLDRSSSTPSSGSPNATGSSAASSTGWGSSGRRLSLRHRPATRARPATATRGSSGWP